MPASSDRAKKETMLRSTRQKVALSVRTLARTATRTLVRLESRLAHEYARTALRLLLDCLGTILITHLDRTPRERVHYTVQVATYSTPCLADVRVKTAFVSGQGRRRLGGLPPQILVFKE